MPEFEKSSSPTDEFTLIAFGADGVAEGKGRWRMDSLSRKWIDQCVDYLNEHGDNFDAPSVGNASHIRMKFTGHQGAALLSFSANGVLIASVALAKGTSPSAEASVLAMFVESLRRVELVRLTARASDPFQEVLATTDRPLMVVVPWADAAVSEEHHQMVRELALHLAAAFFSAA